MELEKFKSIWKTYNRSELDSISRESIEKSLRKRSKNVFFKIRRNMILELIFGWLFCPLFLVMAFRQELQIVLVATILLQVFMIFITWAYVKVFQKSRQILKQNTDLKTRLSNFINYFQKSINLGLKVNFILVPFLSAMGLLLGFSFSAQENVYTKLATPRIQITLLIVYIIYTALCYPYVRWIFRKLYGKNLKKMRGYLAELEGSEYD